MTVPLLVGMAPPAVAQDGLLVFPPVRAGPASIQVDGVPRGTTSASRTVNISVVEGTHGVVVRLPDGRVSATSIVVEAGRLALVRYSFPPPQTGRPSVTEPTPPTHQATSWPSPFRAEDFVLVPAGSFQMGSSTNPDEQPVHSVTITRRFYLQKTEVTQAQWQAVMGTNPSHFAGCGPECPVEQVSWDDAQEFVRRLNGQRSGGGFRLPTEAEWEYSARAGATGDYGGSGVADRMGWFAENSGLATHPVGQKLANAWGLYDMHGNVWEWVQDWYSDASYSSSPPTNPAGPVTGLSPVLRGGSWHLSASYARAAYRYNLTPVTRDYEFGLRLARTP